MEATQERSQPLLRPSELAQARQPVKVVGAAPHDPSPDRRAARTTARWGRVLVALRRRQLLRVHHRLAAAGSATKLGHGSPDGAWPPPRSSPGRAPFSELTFAHLTAAIRRRLRPRFAGIAVADVDAARGERPLDVGQVPQGRVGSRFVVAQEVKEDPFRLHLDRHVVQRRAGRPSQLARTLPAPWTTTGWLMTPAAADLPTSPTRNQWVDLRSSSH